MKVIVISGGKTTVTERPRIELPPDHPYHRYMERIENTWIGPNEDGVWFLQITDHETAKGLVAKTLPEVMEQAKKSGRDHGFCQAFTSRDNLQFHIMSGMFVVPDADDPLRLESGWCVFMVRGGIEKMGKYHEMMKAQIKAMFRINPT